jgi:Zn-dependent protease with chaperone function
MVAVYASGGIACFTMAPIFYRFQSLVDVFVVFIPILTFYFLSRRYEYDADQTAVEFTHDPKMAIHALANLHRITQAPANCNHLTALFLSHPTFIRRAWAIGRTGEMSDEQISEVTREVH